MSRAAAERAGTQRLFVAVWPTPEAVAHLAATLADPRPGGDALRWQPPERWHVTLAFLGQADPEAAVARLGRVRRPAVEPLHLAVAGAFGPVLWIGVQHGPWLTGLGRAVRSALHVEDGRNRPHLTIARARGPAGVRVAREAVSAFADYRGPAWTPPGLTLVRSTTGPAPRYEVIAAWPFDAPPVLA